MTCQDFSFSAVEQAVTNALPYGDAKLTWERLAENTNQEQIILWLK